MPTYSYACTECDHRFEIVQSFSEDSLTECPECGGRLRKVFNSVGIVFKGGGFYKTDSRSASSASSPAAKPAEGASSVGATSGSSGTSGSSAGSGGSSGSSASSTGAAPGQGSSTP